jgi:hypothetical protein
MSGVDIISSGSARHARGANALLASLVPGWLSVIVGQTRMAFGGERLRQSSLKQRNSMWVEATTK